MEPENIDWNSVESIFVKDDTYENFEAPQWVDLSAPDEPIDDELWFCNPDCELPKNDKNFLKPRHNLKVKLLGSVTISEILPFRDRNRGDVKQKEKEKNSSSAAKFRNPKSLKAEESYCSQNSIDDSENKNPNASAPVPLGRIKSKKVVSKPSTETKKQLDESSGNSSKHDKKPHLRSTFSARNLLGGREILNQITEFCAELRKFGRSKKATEKEQRGILDELKERVRDRERMPLLVIKEERA